MCPRNTGRIDMRTSHIALRWGNKVSPQHKLCCFNRGTDRDEVIQDIRDCSERVFEKD